MTAELEWTQEKRREAIDADTRMWVVDLLDRMKETIRDLRGDLRTARRHPVHGNGEPPIPMEEVIKWCRVNRHDVLASIIDLANAAEENRAAEGMQLLISIAFNAGRTFQASPKNAEAYLPLKKDPYE